MTVEILKGFEPVNLFMAAAAARKGNGWAALMFELEGKPQIGIFSGESLELYGHVLQWQLECEANPGTPQPRQVSDAVDDALRRSSANLLAELLAEAYHKAAASCPVNMRGTLLFRLGTGDIKPIPYTFQGMASVNRLREVLAERERIEANPAALLAGVAR